jgi:hypothetical protein
MICVDRKQRITCEHALKHEWFQVRLKDTLHTDEDQQNINHEVIQRLKQFKGESALKKAALNVLVKMLNPEEIQNLKIEFEKIDTDKSGFIEFQELDRAIKNANFSIPENELNSIMQELDYKGN